MADPFADGRNIYRFGLFVLYLKLFWGAAELRYHLFLEIVMHQLALFLLKWIEYDRRLSLLLIRTTICLLQL